MQIISSGRVELEGCEVRLLAIATEDCSFFEVERGMDGVLLVDGFTDATKSQVHRQYKIIGTEIFVKDPYSGEWGEMYNLLAEMEAADA